MPARDAATEEAFASTVMFSILFAMSAQAAVTLPSKQVVLEVAASAVAPREAAARGTSAHN